MVMENRLEVGRVRGGCGKCVPIKGQHAGVSQGWRHVSVSSLWWLPQSTHVLEFIRLYTHTKTILLYFKKKPNQNTVKENIPEGFVPAGPLLSSGCTN